MNIQPKNTKEKGILTEYKAKLWFLERGYSVSEPIGDNDRYDFIVDFNGKLVRFQSKTSNLTRTANCLNFATARLHSTKTANYRTKYTKDEIDYFATYWENKCYLIPVEECSTQKNLRLTDTTKSGQVKGISFAKDYELSLQLQKIKEEVN